MVQGNGQTSLRELMCEALAELCPHCGKDTREKLYGWWPTGGQSISACCKEQLIQTHGADPDRITRQSLRGLFGADPARMLEQINAALARR